MGIGGPQGIERFDDMFLDVENDTDLNQIYPDASQLAGKMLCVRLRSASGQNFLTDDEHRGSRIRHDHHPGYPMDM